MARSNEMVVTKSAREASLTSVAWMNLEAAAQKAVNGSGATIRMHADAAGITMHVTDRHGAQVILQNGVVSAKVASAE
jgi:hypothetical protein